MSNKLLFILLFIPYILSSQECSYKLEGIVQDGITKEPIPKAIIIIEELKIQTESLNNGTFLFSKICPGSYHIKISHLGCEIQKHFIRIDQDTALTFTLNHFSHTIEGAVITAKSTKKNLQEIQTISEQKINENAHLNLSNILESVSGVNTLKNGNGISKPIIHGLYGNRILIVNNGIPQNGQQWGNDHSPEIDPFVANKLTVIKGVGAVEYMGSSLGSVILVESKKIKSDPHLHGKANAFAESNGRGVAINVQLEKYASFLAWKLTGTLKKNGDKSTPSYFLKNTGSQELNLALQLEKSLNSKWNLDAYLSSFNTELGILRGSHIGNLTDLQNAWTRDVPFYTSENFSYSIDAPRQVVHHHLFKFHSRFTPKDKQFYDFTFATQINQRQEFDIRRNNRSEIPALSLLQITHFIEAKHSREYLNNWTLKYGLQVNLSNNTNNPETGIIPLIPDYLQNEMGFYTLVQKKYDKLSLEMGGRYDYKYQSVASITNSTPSKILNYKNNFHNISASLGCNYFISNPIQINWNIGFAHRNPAINELYSAGLHQGVSGLEEGDPTLQKETSIKSTFSIQGRIKEKLFFESLLYAQNIYDYMYLQAQNEPRVTIRGAFPVFKYKQTNAQILGLDLTATYNIIDDLSASMKTSLIKGRDLTQNIPLVYIPANNVTFTLHYHLHAVKFLKDLELELNSKYVMKQTDLLAQQDFVAAPDAYFLLGTKVSFKHQFKKNDFKNYLKIDNLLNNNYRDYLNRLRYFANEMGINIVLGTTLSF